MQPWSPWPLDDDVFLLNPLPERPSGEEARFSWSHADGPSSFRHEVHFLPTASDEVRWELLLRSIAHVIVDRVPAQALNETLHSLQQLFVSYPTTVQSALVSAVPIKATPATLGARRKREDFYATED
jgi:hypothetical protein